MRKLTVAVLLIISIPTYAHNYFGVDYKHRWLRGRNADNYSMREVLKESYDGYEVYAAHRFSNDVGLSLGWEQSATQDKTHVFFAGEGFLGNTQNQGDSTFTQTQIRAINIDVNGFLNISERFEAVGHLGLSFMDAHMNGTLTSGGVVTNLEPSRGYKPVPRIGIIFQYFVFHHVGIRVSGHWVGTNMYHQKFTNNDGIRYNIKPFTQSWTAAVGIVGKFR